MFFAKNEVNCNREPAMQLDYNNQEMMTNYFKSATKTQISQLTSIDKLEYLDGKSIPRIGHKISAEQIAALKGVQCIIFTGRMCRFHRKNKGLIELPANIKSIICSFENQTQKESFPLLIPEHISVYEQISSNSLCLVRPAKLFISTPTKLQAIFVPHVSSENEIFTHSLENNVQEQQTHRNLKRKWNFIEEAVEEKESEIFEKDDIESIKKQLATSLHNEEKLKAQLIRKNNKIKKKNIKLKQVTDIVERLEQEAISIIDISRKFKMNIGNKNYLEDDRIECKSDLDSTSSESSSESSDDDNSINPKDYHYIPLIDKVISSNEMKLNDEIDQKDNMSIPRF